jgi:hypothetical protein
MNIELPKDAEGREIPLDVDALYDKNGNRVEVFRWNYVRGRNNNWTFNRLFEFVTVPLYPQDYFLTPLDSWEKLEEDLGRASKRDAVVSCCRYFTADKCANCPIHGNDSCCLHKEELAFGDILDRIRKLRGEG